MKSHSARIADGNREPSRWFAKHVSCAIIPFDRWAKGERPEAASLGRVARSPWSETVRGFGNPKSGYKGRPVKASPFWSDGLVAGATDQFAASVVFSKKAWRDRALGVGSGNPRHRHRRSTDRFFGNYTHHRTHHPPSGGIVDDRGRQSGIGIGVFSNAVGSKMCDIGHGSVLVNPGGRSTRGYWTAIHDRLVLAIDALRYPSEKDPRLIARSS